MKLKDFEALANRSGLVSMEIRKAFAPYPEGSKAGFAPKTALALFESGQAAPFNKFGQAVEPPSDAERQIRRGATPGVRSSDVQTADGSGPSSSPDQDASIVIPENWKTMHHLQRVKLGKEIAGDGWEVPEGKGPSEHADDVIEAELARRAGGTDDEDEAGSPSDSPTGSPSESPED